MTLFAEVPKVVRPDCLVWKLGFLGLDHILMKALEQLICFVNPTIKGHSNPGWLKGMDRLPQTDRSLAAGFCLVVAQFLVDS